MKKQPLMNANERESKPLIKNDEFPGVYSRPFVVKNFFSAPLDSQMS